MAMSKTFVKVEGLSELVAGLDELPKATSTNVQKRALKEAADPIASTAQNLAPKRTGRLEESIVVGTKLSPRQRAGYKKESKIEVFVGPASMPRAIVMEFGSVHVSARPYMRPAWDQNKRQALASIGDILGREIIKAADRAARKAAKLLAAMNAS